MFNNTGITKVTGAAPVQILFNVQNQLSVPIIVDDAYYVTKGTKKIVPAGTPLYGDLTARNAVSDVANTFVKASTTSTKIGATDEQTPVDVKVDKSNAVGVLLHDVDVTNGDNNGTLLIWGFVDMNKLDTTTAALITAEVKEALKGNVTFLK